MGEPIQSPILGAPQTGRQPQKLSEQASGLFCGPAEPMIRYADDTTRMENEEELKSLLMKVKEEC